ncbi:MAG: hypothetical protein GQ524_10920 [Anaerolineales bacterium]|nr:hypothetical protein [Anaerolineales bacterium]
MRTPTGKTLRIIAIIFMGLTAAMNILSGVGTSCAAFLTKDYPPFWDILVAELQWLWQSFVFVTLLIGLAGIWSVVQLVRGKSNAYRNAMILLVLGTIVNGIHVYYSQIILGSVIPVAITLLTNVITLVLFIIFGTPGLRDQIMFDGEGDPISGATASGLTAILVGMILLSISSWAGPSHTFADGVNLVNVLRVPLLAGGSILTMGGLATLLWTALDITFPRAIRHSAEDKNR